MAGVSERRAGGTGQLSSALPPDARRIRVTGIVQGVGFRPFVWRLARELGLAGWVRNDPAGVDIALEGISGAIDALMDRVRSEAPPLARVDTVTAVAANLEGYTGFEIVESGGGQATTAIGPDVAVCHDCLAELFDPVSRRWRHGFITCTHCGPRFTVTRSLPYDRPQTSLAPFPLCPSCTTEYTDPADRRFHAETTCCPQCGPQLKLTTIGGEIVPGDPIEATLGLLRSGAIVAIKGLGGFHLACDARNATAVARLRERKHREAKPFAVMVANVGSLAGLAQVTPQEQALLESRERPVVLLRKQDAERDPLPGVAPDLAWLGAMLPTTPIQFLLFHEAAGRPPGTAWLNLQNDLVLVMTSANPGGEPIVRNEAEALDRLGEIADAVLGHDRDVVARCDDSVIRVVAGTPHFIRRSRGFAPAAIRLPKTGPSVLAFGAHLKNTVCVTRGDEAFLSPHIGDLDNAATARFLDETVARMLDLLDIRPERVAHDLHPDTYSTQAAQGFAGERQIPVVAVQHHHAHIAAVCAEHGWTKPVLGLALDGVGLGSDGSAWGGELLRVDGAKFERLGHLRPLPLPGGDKAAREPWRMAAAVLHLAGRHDEITSRFTEPAAATVATMLERGVNCPPASSLGRVFDAAAGLLGINHVMQFEAQAAMQLEQAALRFIECAGWPVVAEADIESATELDLVPLLAGLTAGGDIGHSAARFHVGVADALTDWVVQAAGLTGLDTLAWSGGCFFNHLLSLRLRQNLEQRGIRLLVPQLISPGDGGIAIGQAWVAMQTKVN
jgi:hydrogenase maturation protein HypF